MTDDEDLLRVPIEDWGKDHFSLLAYLETLAVDSYLHVPGCGEIARDRMRCNESRHGLLQDQWMSIRGGSGWKPSYGTRLAGFFTAPGQTDVSRQLPEHDDWDCLEDLEAAGMIEWISAVNGYFRLLPLGQALAAQIRRHKAAGGVFANFSPTLPILAGGDHVETTDG